MALNEKYLLDGSRLLGEGDYVQASEKYWGAVATMIKATATRIGLKHRNHAELSRVVRDLRAANDDDQFVSLFKSAETLHANFYDNFLSAEQIEMLARDARLLVDKLKDAGLPR